MVKVQNDLSDPLEIKMAFDRDALLLILALKKVVRDSNINTRGHIFIQLLTFADGIDIIASNTHRTKTCLLIFRERRLRDGTENQ
ncbi:hypothetical protein TNCV_2291561 [Trichonephila clavipes]|uniref:Uncharacterized protein n=1 Tax=Trichonephila clavipes TaxID=2585209 RepID=A0A8X6V200_TRICX|nr:hypothetical protein TNCV_2291561 [Trichonephila clavipes]